MLQRGSANHGAEDTQPWPPHHNQLEHRRGHVMLGTGNFPCVEQVVEKPQPLPYWTINRGRVQESRVASLNFANGANRLLSIARVG